MDRREGNGTPFQYSCLENPMDGGAWWAAVHGVSNSRTRLSDFAFTFTLMHWRRKWQPTPVFLPGEPRGQRSLAATDHGGPKSGTWGLAAKPAPPREHSRQKHGNTTGESKKETHLLSSKTCDTYCHLMNFFVVGVFGDLRKGSCPSFLPISPP